MQKKNAFNSPKVLNTLQKVLLLLRQQTGQDFSLYKKNTLFRRLERRMHMHQVPDLEQYLAFLQDNAKEVQTLLKEFLIGVTRFFRDYPAFQVLEEKILPQLIGSKGRNEPLRIWVAGCSTGEEAYSVAILVREILEKSKARYPMKVHIFATDLDKTAIERARKGLYYSNMGADMSAERLNRWFTKQGEQYQVNQEIREMVVFAEHNLAKDPAFTKLDLLCCRNVFIYFTPELQRKLLPVFHYTLSPGGVLFLGPSESINGLEDSFETLDVKWKFYRRREVSNSLVRVIDFPGQQGPVSAPPVPPAGEERKPRGLEESVRNLLLEGHTPAAVLITAEGEILYVNGSTGRYLEFKPGGVQVNLFSMAREGLVFDLRNAAQRALNEKQTVTVPGLKLKTGSEMRLLKLTVRYLESPEEVKGLLLVLFEEGPLPRRKTAKTPAAESNSRTEELEAEISRLRSQLQQVREEKDVTVEEIRAANEELQSTNEELQSTNEEAISAKEELQSLNEELMTVNLELREKTDLLEAVNNDMANFLNSSGIATLFLDGQLRIRRFTPAATAVFHLVTPDVGRPLSHIRSKLHYERIEQDAQQVMERLTPKEVEVESLDHKTFVMRMMPYRTQNNFIDGVVLTFVDVTALKALQASQQASKQLAENIIDSVRDPMLVLDGELRVVAASRAFTETFRVDMSQTKGKLLNELGNGQWNIPRLRELLDGITGNDGEHSPVVDDFVVEHSFPRIGLKRMKLHARHVVNVQGQHQDHLVLLTIEDIT
jgi:two-component system CheB/CheR fusion protein